MPLETDAQFAARRLAELKTQVADLEGTAKRLRLALKDAMSDMSPCDLAHFAAKHSSAATLVYFAFRKWTRDS